MAKRLLVVFAIVAGLLLAIPASADMAGTRFSLTEAGAQADGGSWAPTMDAAGRFVAFHSWADNLGPRDSNYLFDVYVRDRIFGFNHLISASPLGGPGDQQSVYPAISADGLHVAFCSTAGNFVLGGTNGHQQIYVNDWKRGVMELVSVSPAGEPANADCSWPAVSGEGRFVVFESSATNLYPGALPISAVYLRDRQLGTTQCVSLSSTGVFTAGPSYQPTITPEGRFIVFISWGVLVPGDTNFARHIYLFDQTTGTLELVSVANGTGALGNGDSGGPRPAITPDGRFVAFASAATNLVDNDTNGHVDVFVRDRQTGTTELVSQSSSGDQGNNDSGGASSALGISAEGRFVVFSSLASNLVPDDNNGVWDAFRYDRQTHTITRMSVTPAGVEGDGDSGFYGIATSAAGDFTVWDSRANNLVPGDTNKAMDVFLYSSTTPTGYPRRGHQPRRCLHHHSAGHPFRLPRRLFRSPLLQRGRELERLGAGLDHQVLDPHLGGRDQDGLHPGALRQSVGVSGDQR